MKPFIYVLGRPIPMYGLSALVGLLFAAALIFLTTRKRRDYSKIHIVNIPLFAAIGAFIGAHLVYGITRIEVLTEAIRTNTFEFATLTEMFGGMVFYGGLLGAILAAFIYCKAAKADFSLFADIFAPAIPLFHAFGRIGCTFAGCCYGLESAWGVPVLHNDGHDHYFTLTHLPIPLIEAGCNLLIMVLLLLLRNKKLKKGSLLAIYFIVYAVVRFTDEFFRGDAIRGKLWGLSTSQWISMLVLVLGVFMLLNRYALKNKDKFGYRVKTGDIPEGYLYNKYAGAVAPWDQHKLKNLDPRITFNSDGTPYTPPAQEASPAEVPAAEAHTPASDDESSTPS